MTCEPRHEITELRPGQLWQWNFSFGDGTWWFTPVTEAGRTTPDWGRRVTMKRGDMFTLVTLDDPGPYELPTMPTFDDAGNILPAMEIKLRARYDVVLVGDTLVWFEHDNFEHSELLTDVV